MMCKCGFENIESAKFCSECGEQLKFTRTMNIPKMITIKEAQEKVFSKTVSLTKIYDLVRTRTIPHVKIKGKILLDIDKTIEWWNNQLNESTKPIKLSGLRKIM